MPFTNEEFKHFSSLLADLHEENNRRCYKFFSSEEHQLQNFVNFAKSGQAAPLSYMLAMSNSRTFNSSINNDLMKVALTSCLQALFASTFRK